MSVIRKKRRPKVFVLLFIIIISAVLYLNYDPLCLFPYVILRSFPKLDSRDNTDVTIVTAFFDLGPFHKGDPASQLVYTPQKYFEWGSAFKYLQNPLVLFTDSPEMEECFRRNNVSSCQYRGNESFREPSWRRKESELTETKKQALVMSDAKPRVKVIRVYDRTKFFAFQKLNRVREIFADPAYPKMHPNTVLPEYACTQHAKMDLMEAATLQNYFNTKYFAWLDLGYFRYTTFRKRKFWIVVPPEMDDRKIAVNELKQPATDVDPSTIFKGNAFWLGGGMVLGTAQTVWKFVEEYRHAVDYFLSIGLFNTDQQLIYSMFKSKAAKNLGVTTELQVFAWPFNRFRTCWFYLGYRCYREE